MKPSFFEITEPYSAVIKAHDENEVLKVYEEIVADVEDKDCFFEDLEVISDEKVKEQLTRCFDEETNEVITKEKQKEIFNQLAPCLIVMERM